MATPEPLAKHVRYGDAYAPGDTYWGIGVENETYVELRGGVITTAEFVEKHQVRERYSVDYWNIYRAGATDAVIQAWCASLPQGKDTDIRLPLLMNAHSFTKCDRYGEHATLYTKTKERSVNPRFCGTTLLEELARVEPAVFQAGRDVWWTFDGDSIEFMTQAFYCAKLEDVVTELLEAKGRWIGALQRGLATLDRELALQKTPAFVQKNHGLAVFLTNRRNVAIFNNGTYHFNLTLPTRLDKDARIANPAQFRTVHQNAARLFQWMSPFLVARFGAGDVFATLGPRNSASRAFPAGSQRLCASRYVSIGTYDTDTMPTGKLLTFPRPTGGNGSSSWYDRVYTNPACAYLPLPEIGLDINFQKHWNHGLEFRIFDWFPEAELEGVLRAMVWMCDESNCATRPPPPNPRTVPAWNAVTARVVWEGTDALITDEEAAQFRAAVRAPLVGGMRVVDAYGVIWSAWRERWNWSKGTYTATMIRAPLPATVDDLTPVAAPPIDIVEEDTAIPLVRIQSTATLLTAVPNAVPTVPTVPTVPPRNGTTHRRWWACFCG